jgi:nicotinate-nucleotide--dimethylbenzimidazole phosphoribosyltransferase
MVIDALKIETSRIQPLDEEAMIQTDRRLQQLTKPIGSLGQLERMVVQLAGIFARPNFELVKKAVIVMAADHGVCVENVSQYPQAVTGQMVLNFLHGGAAINVLSRLMNAAVVCVDIGVAHTIQHPQLLCLKTRESSGNIVLERAMSKTETVAAIIQGLRLVERLVHEGYRSIATGEMGIGNTTVSSALLASMIEGSVELVVGYGTGINEDMRTHKIGVIERAVNRYHHEKETFEDEDCFMVELERLSHLGGFEIAGLVGVIIGAAVFRVPVVIDGFISTVAAVVAARLAPACKAFMFPSHLSEEPGHRVALTLLELTPYLSLNMRLGEGTGAVLCFPLLDSSVAILNEMATFESAGIATQRNE